MKIHKLIRLDGKNDKLRINKGRFTLIVSLLHECDAHCIDAKLISHMIRLTNQHTLYMQHAVSTSVRLAEQPLIARKNLARHSGKLPTLPAAQHYTASVNPP